MQSQLIVITGPSGVGKNTIADQIKMHADLRLEPITKWTTRRLRAGERPGDEFLYVTPEEFKQKIAADELLEYNHYNDNYYGVPKAAIVATWQKGKRPLLNLDIHGARALRSLYPEKTILIFLTAPLAELKKRLETRGDLAPGQITERLAIAKKEIQEQHWFDLVVDNPANHPERATETIVKFLKSRLE